VTDNREPIDQTEENAEAGEEQLIQPAPEADGESLRDAVGAYLLDALPNEERQEFEAFLATSPETQEELRQLAPVVTLLPILLELEPGDETSAPAPTVGLRDRILSEAQAERDVTREPATDVESGLAADGVEPMEELAEAAADQPDSIDGARSRTIRTAPQGTGPFEPKRRPRPSSQGRVATTRTSPTPFGTITQFPASWLIAAAITVVAIGAIIWALALQSRIDSKDREIAAQSERLTLQESEITELQQNDNATAFTLSASDGAAGNASGTLLFSPSEQIGVLYVREMPPLARDHVYQLWYLDDQGAPARPGGTFRVDRSGNGMIAVESDTPTFDRIALTAEPEGGSQAPTSDPILLGRIGGAAG
jgi:anti-sigma factor RsiW